MLAIVVGAILIGTTFAPEGLAAESGFDQSFAQPAGHVDPDVALIRLVTSYPGGPNLTCSLTVAGTFQLADPAYGYTVFFGGNDSTNSRAFATFTNNVTAGTISHLYGSSVGYFATVAPLPFALANASSTLSFGVNATLVSPAFNFTVNAEALLVNATVDQSSTLGSATSSSGPAPGALPGTLVLAIVVPLVAVAAVGIAVVLVRRRRRPPQLDQFV